MSENAKHSPEAIALAAKVLAASGSGMQHYTMHSTRTAILDAAQEGISQARKPVLDALEALWNAYEYGENEGEASKLASDILKKAKRGQL